MGTSSRPFTTNLSRMPQHGWQWRVARLLDPAGAVLDEKNALGSVAVRSPISPMSSECEKGAETRQGEHSHPIA